MKRPAWTTRALITIRRARHYPLLPRCSAQ